nr:LPD38 domain-containing protein [Halomonas sp.]
MNAAEDRTPPKWTDIANDPDFQAADWQTKQRVRGEFYRRAIEPNTPASLREDVQSQFFARTASDVFGERETPNLASNALRNAGERGLDLAGNALQFVGNVADRGEQAITDALGGINPGVIGGSVDEMRERGYEPDVALGGFGLDFTMRAKPEDTSTGLIDTGQAVEDISLGYQPNYTIDRALDEPSIRTIAGAAAEQGPAALADMAGLVVSLPAYLAARTQEIGEGRVENDNREGMPEGRDYAVSGPTAAASVLLDRFALGRLLPGSGNAVTSARQIPGAVGRAAATESVTEAIQEGGIEYAGESVGTETGWNATTAARRAAGGVIVGGPTGGAVRAGTAAMELRGNNQQGSEQPEPSESPAEQSSPAPEEAPTPEAETANDEAIGTAAELIAKPRFELSSAEREVRDSISYGDAFKALRAAAEARGDSDAVAELDAVSSEISAALEAETIARSRNDSDAFTPIREQLKSASERFTRVMDRLNTPEAESKASAPSANKDGNAQWEEAWREQAAQDGIADYDPNANLPDTTITINGEQVADESLVPPETLDVARQDEQAEEVTKEVGQPAVAQPEPALAPDQPSPNPDTKTPRRVPVESIQVDPEAYQFRAEVNDQGVDTRLEGIEKWDDLRAGNLILHERTDGSVYAADGHHRINLARQLQQPDVNAIVLREADGVTVEDARRAAAEANIAAGSATALDSAKVFRNSNGDIDTVIRESNLPRTQLVRDGADIAKLDTEPFGAVLNKVITEKDGAVIGRSFADPDQQLAAVGVFQRVKPTNDNQRELLANEVRQAGFAESQGEQGGLFGNDPAESLIGERVKVMDSLRQTLVRDKRLFATLNDNAQTAEQAGNRIAKDRNNALQETSADAIALLERATTTPEINQQINDAARRVKDGETLASVTRELKEALLNGTNSPAASEGRTPAPSSGQADQAGQDAGRSEPVPASNDARTARSGEQRPRPGAGAQAEPAVTLKTDGTPFQTRRAVELSRRFRDTPNAQPVEVEGGWGFAVADTPMQNAESTKPAGQNVSGLTSLPYGGKRWNKGTKTAEEMSGQAPIVDYSGRRVVLKDVNGVTVPFYQSTGAGGKAATKPGQWYPFTGIGSDGWINKLGDADISQYYGSPALRQAAQELDATVGDIRSRDDIPKTGTTGTGQAFIDAVNSAFDGQQVSANNQPDSKINVQSSVDALKTAVDSQTSDLALETQTEESLAQREQEVQAAEQTEADQRNQEAQRAQADAEVDDFTLSGSNRTADVAAARGQSDLLGAQPASNENTPPSEQQYYRDWPLLDEMPDGWKRDPTAGSPLARYEFATNGRSVLSGQQERALVRIRPAPAAGQNTDSPTAQVQQDLANEAPKPKRRNQPLQYTGYSGEQRSVRSYQEVGNFRIAKVNDSLYEVINPDGQAVSQRAGADGAAQEAQRLNDLPADDQRYAIGQSDARPVSRDAIEEALASSPELSDVTVIQSATELPPQSILMMALQGVTPRDVRGLFVGDQLYVIADNVDDVQEGVRTAVHEAVGHKGMRAVLGDELETVMRQVYNSLPLDPRGREALNEVLESYPFLDQSNPEHQLTIAEEMVAHLTEKGWQPNVIRRAVAKIRELLRRYFPSMNWTDADVMQLSERSREYLRSQQEKAQASTDPWSDMRFSMATPPGGNFNPNDSTNFALPDETLSQTALRKMADKMNRLKVTQEAIKQAGGNINEDNDVYLAEELFHGKTERDLNELSRNYVEKLAKGMAARGIQQEELDAYLYARHAPERNARIAERNPNDPKYADGGSGMTNAEAAAIMQEAESSGKKLRLERLAAIVDDMLAHRREIIREGGLETDEVLDAWDASYDYYVPLKGWANDEDVPVGQDGSGRMRSGRGYEIGGRETKTALGRLSKAASPSTQAIVDTTESVIRKRKNEVGNALLSLITDNPNPDLWQVFTNNDPDTQRTQVERTNPDGTKRIEVEERPVAMEMNERYFKTKKAGRTYYIKINDQRLLNAMRNVGPEQNNLLVRTAAAGTRALSAMMTSYNPEFMLSNFTRDVQTALLNVAAEQTRDDGKIKGQKIARQTARDIPRAMKAAYRGLADPDASRNTEWDRWFDEFIEDGAKTGYFDMKDLAGQAKEIKSIIGRENGGTMGNMLKAKKTVADFVENMNGSVENAVRLSAYVNARRAGISRKKAASLAKNLTVNFNRRGEAGTALNAAYMFANASIQGTMNVARTMVTVKDTPVGGNRMNIWGRMNAAQKLAVGMAVGSYAMAMFNRMMSDEDDDGELFYDKIPGHVKERNLIIMTGGKDYVRIPLPYGYSVFSNIGTHAESVMSGKSSLTEAGKDMTLAILGSFSPIGFQDSEDISNLVMKNLTPTLLGSVTQVAVNEDFAGRVIFKENFPSGTPKPYSSLAFRSTPSAYQSFAQFINELTGGSEYRSGGIDVSPDVLQHVVNYYGGGAWSFTEKVADSIKRTATGETIDAHRIPFVGRFKSEVNEYGDIQTFYERRTEVGQLHEEFINLPREEARSFYDEHGGKIALFDMAKDLEKTLTELRKVRDAIEADERLTPEERDEQLDEIEDAMDSEVDFFNLLYNQAEGTVQSAK